MAVTGRARALAPLLAVALALSGCTGPQRIVIMAPRVADTADYTLVSVQILSPPPQPGAGTVTVRIVYDLHVAGGNVSPMVWVFDDDSFLRFSDDVIERANFVAGTGGLSSGRHDGTLTFDLSCDGDEVVGSEGGTGEGHREFLIGNVNEAEIRAAAQRPGAAGNPVVASDPVDLWCEA